MQINKTIAIGLFFSLVFVGCAHNRPSQAPGATEIAPSSSPDGMTHLAPLAVPSTVLEVNGVRLQNTQFDIPVIVNPHVEKWINYFTGRGRTVFTKYLARAEYFIPYIQQILRQNGMPQDLVYLSLIESGFNNNARSRARAVGPWQFMSYTGTRYGLAVNWWIDERRDVQKSTHAAIRYLKDLYAMYQDWELATASYNAGEAKIGRAIKKYKTSNFWELIKGRYLKPETKNYVPKLMAAAILVKNKKQFGFNVGPIEPGVDEAIAPDGQIVHIEKSDKDKNEDGTFSQKALADAQESEEAMSSFIEELDEIDDDTEIADEPNVGGASLFVSEFKESKEDLLAKPIPTPHVNKKGEISSDHLVEFEVQSPADMLKIARAAGLSYMTVKSLNPEVMRWCTPPHLKTYRIKLPETVKAKFLETYNHPAFPRKVKFRIYKAGRGDTLKAISKRFGIKSDPILDLNGRHKVNPNGSLKSGSEIYLPMPTDQSRSIASLELYDPPEKRKRRRSRSAQTYKVSYKERKSARSR